MKTTQMPNDRWMGKEAVVYNSVEYYAALNESVLFAETWTELEDIMLSETS